MKKACHSNSEQDPEETRMKKTCDEIEYLSSSILVLAKEIEATTTAMRKDRLSAELESLNASH